MKDSIIAALILLILVGGLVIGVTALSGLRAPVQHGEYSGTVIDYTHQRGIFLKTNDLTTKTHERSSQREDWCVPDNQPELVSKVRDIKMGSNVDIAYHSPLYVWPDTCAAGTKVIKSITIKE